jgi:uncharacterized protein YcbK (DUF882 family)
LDSSQPRLSRRDFTRSLVSAAALLLLAPRGLRAAPVQRKLSLLHLHTHEELSVVYCDESGYRRDALARLDQLLRDFRTEQVHAIDPTLFDLLHATYTATGSREPFQIISGYRSPRTNQMLRSHGGGGVASGSMHLQGKAIDVRLPDVATSTLRDVGLKLARGGVGYYRASDFVHLDTGRVRRW